MKRSHNVRVSELNPHLMCVLCGGYYVDATTIIECLHSFCKTCIVRYLDSSKFCPICDVQVHKTKPLLNIRPDHTLQELVYKLVPGLFTREVLKRREFYRKNPGSASSSGSEAGSSPDGAGDPLNSRGRVAPNDTMSISLEFSVEGKVVQSRKGKGKARDGVQGETILQKRYLLCPASFTIGHVKKFIRMKLDLSPTLEVDVFHTDEPLSDSYALLDITHIYNWTKNEPFPLYFSVFENSAKRQKCDENLAEAKVEPQPEAADDGQTDDGASDVKSTHRKSSSPSPADDAGAPPPTPAVASKSVKRKLEPELSAVEQTNTDRDPEPNVVEEEAKTGEREENIAERFYEDLNQRQSNGCKISTSSSGKSIVVSIPKHLLENSGSDKEKKKKKSKRKDSRHHHRHHHKHKHQSRDEGEEKSKRRKPSRDIDSSLSNSPRSDVNTTPEAGEVRDSDNGSTTVIASDETEVGGSEKSASSSPRTDSNAAVAGRQGAQEAAPENGNQPEAAEATEAKAGLASGKIRRESVVAGERTASAAQREPVLHQLQEEWRRQLLADEQSRGGARTEAATKSDAARAAGDESAPRATSGEEKKAKSAAKWTRDSPIPKKAPVPKVLPKKTTSGKQRQEAQSRQQKQRTETGQKQKQSVQDGVSKTNHETPSEAREDKAKDAEEKTPSEQSAEKKDKEPEKEDQKKASQEAKKERREDERDGKRGTVEETRQEADVKKQPSESPEGEEQSGKRDGAEKRDSGAENVKETSGSSEGDEKGVVERNSPKRASSQSCTFADDISTKRKPEVSEANNNGKGGSASRGTDAAAASSAISVVSASPTATRKGAALSAPQDGASPAMRPGHVSARLTGPAPVGRADRPDTLNVPIPWKSLSSLAKAGRKVQESANNALGRNSPCASSARTLAPQARPDDKRNGLQPSAGARAPPDRRNNSAAKPYSPFPETISAFESPAMPKGIKTYSKKDKLIYKTQSLLEQSTFTYDSTFKAFLGGSDEDILSHRTIAGSSSAALNSSLLGVSRKEKGSVSAGQRQIHGHKVIGQLNMVYETIQKPGYSEVCRKSAKQASPSKPQPPPVGKVNGERKVSPEGDEGSDEKDSRDVGREHKGESPSGEGQKNPEYTDADKRGENRSSGQDSATTTTTTKETPATVGNSQTSHVKTEAAGQPVDGRAEGNRKCSAEVVRSASDYSRCESSFSATHLPTFPNRYSHKCGASSPPEVLCLKCSPPPTGSPHVTSAPGLVAAVQRPFSAERDRMSGPCPRAAHTACAATGATHAQNNNLSSAAASVDQSSLRCDQCQSAPVAHLYDKMALQEVPLDLHKPRNPPDQ